MLKSALDSKATSTHGGIVAHVFSVSATSESVSITEKIVEDNEKSKIESIFCRH